MTEKECVSIPGLTSRDKRAIRTAFTKAIKNGKRCVYEDCATNRDVIMALPGIKVFNAVTGRYEMQPRIETYDQNNLDILDSELLDDATARTIVRNNLDAKDREEHLKKLATDASYYSRYERESGKALDSIETLLSNMTLEDLRRLQSAVNDAIAVAINEEIQVSELKIKSEKERLEKLRREKGCE